MPLFSQLQISQGTSHTKYCTFAVLPSDNTDDEWDRRQFGHRTNIQDGAHLLLTIQALLPSDVQPQSVWLCPLFADGLKVIFQRVRKPPAIIKQPFHMIENFASVADQYMAECLRDIPVAFDAGFECTVQYEPRIQ